MASPTMTRERLVAPDANAALSAVLERHGMGRKLVLVCDTPTWIAAGDAIFQQLQGKYTVEVHSFGRLGTAALSHSQTLIESYAGFDSFIAVGSGSINDITKYAAAKLGKPYISVATAASMNGYTSATASLEALHFKQSFAAVPPRAVVADMRVISSAPKRLTRAGLGDTLCRTTVETDMLMSHYLLDSPYPKEIFDVLRAHEPGLLTHAALLRDNDASYVSMIMNALLDTGDAMAKFGSSAVASQGEHMIAHTLETMYEAELRYITHGEMIAVTSVTMDMLQHKMLFAQPSVKPLPREEAQFQRLFGKKAGSEIAKIYERKVLSAERAEHINAMLVRDWPKIKKHLQSVILPGNTAERALVQANVGTKVKDLGIADELYISAVTYAYMTRDRFTFLDLAAMNGKRAI